MAASIRPQEVDLLVSVIKRAHSTLNFGDVAQKLGISDKAAAQRWIRLKTKILGKNKIDFKDGDEKILIIGIAQQFGSSDVDLEVVGADLGIHKKAAVQRWNRLRLKIIGGKDEHGMVGYNRATPAGRVTKPAKADTPKKKIAKGKKKSQAVERALIAAEDSEGSEYHDTKASLIASASKMKSKATERAMSGSVAAEDSEDDYDMVSVKNNGREGKSKAADEVLSDSEAAEDSEYQYAMTPTKAVGGKGKSIAVKQPLSEYEAAENSEDDDALAAAKLQGGNNIDVDDSHHGKEERTVGFESDVAEQYFEADYNSEFFNYNAKHEDEEY